MRMSPDVRWGRRVVDGRVDRRPPGPSARWPAASPASWRESLIDEAPTALGSGQLLDRLSASGAKTTHRWPPARSRRAHVSRPCGPSPIIASCIANLPFQEADCLGGLGFFDSDHRPPQSVGRLKDALNGCIQQRVCTQHRIGWADSPSTSAREKARHDPVISAGKRLLPSSPGIPRPIAASTPHDLGMVDAFGVENRPFSGR